jgi:hypothetical protein
MARQSLDRFLEAMDTRLMASRLAAGLATAPGACHVLDAKFEPGVRAVLLYAYDGRLLRGDVIDSEDMEGSPPLVRPGVRVTSFPFDPELPMLEHVVDPDRLASALSAAAGAGFGAGSLSFPRCRVSLLRYRPGKRATLLVSGRGRPRLVVKAYHDADKAAAVSLEAPMLAAATEGTRTLRLAPMAAFLPELAALAHGAVSGVPLDTVLRHGSADGALVRTGLEVAASALAELHDTAPLVGRRRSVDRELRRFAARARGIAAVDPELGDALEDLATRLEEVQHRLPPAGHGTVHGDCKPSQFLLSGRHAYLLDLDHVGTADPATDVGTFLASVRQLAIRQGLSRQPGPAIDVARSASTFLRAYMQNRTASGVDVERIRWHEAVALERKALRAFARAPQSPLPAALVAAAHGCLDTQIGRASGRERMAGNV